MTTDDDGASTRPAPAVLVVAFVALVVMVGANTVAIRDANRELGPFWNAGLRFVIAAIVFAGLAVARGTRLPDQRSIVEAAIYGLCAFAAFFGFLYLGLVRASVGLGQVVLALGPLITLVMAVSIGLERFRWRPVAGGLVALAGIALMYGVDAGSDVPLLSVLSILAAAISFAAGGIVAKRAAQADPVARNAIASGVGAIVLLAVSLAAGERWVVPVDPGTRLSLLYLILPGTVGVFLLFLLLLRHWTATAVSTQFVLAPIVGLTLGAILLAEPVSPPLVAGAALVIGGVWLGAILERLTGHHGSARSGPASRAPGSRRDRCYPEMTWPRPAPAPPTTPSVPPRVPMPSCLPFRRPPRPPGDRSRPARAGPRVVPRRPRRTPPRSTSRP